MKRVLSLVLLLASCTLDPVGGVLNAADLYVRAFDLELGGKLVLHATDSLGRTRTKNAAVTRETMDVLFEDGQLADGDVVVVAELYDPEGTLIGCGTARGRAGSDERVLVGFASPGTDALNCGTCGNRCETDVASGSCVMGVCTAWECPPGLLAQTDGGCEQPVIVIPDAGPMDAGSDAGTMDAGVPDAGMCMPTGNEESVDACSDGADNECDLLTDCADPGCGGITRACSLGACGRVGTQVWSCATRTWGACTGSVSDENNPTACKDGIDNDCDGTADCADAKCNGIKQDCNGGLDVCAAGVKVWNCSTGLFGLCLPYVPVAENLLPLLTCGNGLDDDCDGKVDCADVAQCSGRSCGLGKTCCPDGRCSTSCN